MINSACFEIDREYAMKLQMDFWELTRICRIRPLPSDLLGAPRYQHHPTQRPFNKCILCLHVIYKVEVAVPRGSGAEGLCNSELAEVDDEYITAHKHVSFNLENFISLYHQSESHEISNDGTLRTIYLFPCEKDLGMRSSAA